MKQILWISRHTLTPQQLTSLETFCGGPFRLTLWQESVEQPGLLRSAIEQADVIAAVLPVHLLAAVVEMAGSKPVLVEIANRKLVPGDGEPSVVFSHGGWHRVARLDVELVPV